MEFLSGNDINKIDYRPLFLKHVTRHLRTLSSDARKILLDLGFNDQQIEALLATHGSKFNKKIADPRQIIDISKEILSKLAVRIAWELKHNRTKEVAQARIEITNTHKQALGLSTTDALGTCNVVAINKTNQKLVKKESRGSAEATDAVAVNVIEGLPMPTTDTLVITLHRDPKTYELTAFSAYSGVVTPSLPLPDSKSQSPAELKESKEYWDNHAFLR